jgi:hypothetical protein
MAAFAPASRNNGNQARLLSNRESDMNGFGQFCLLLAVASASLGATLPSNNRQFLDKHCFECHDDDLKKGDLDLTALKFDPSNSTNFSTWVLVHDRVSKGEMPPKKKPRPATAEVAAFTNFLASSLISAEQARIAKEGRATQRRLNRYEYENTLRDLLHAPWLQIRDSLPEDGEAYRFRATIWKMCQCFGLPRGVTLSVSSSSNISTSNPSSSASASLRSRNVMPGRPAQLSRGPYHWPLKRPPAGSASRIRVHSA